MDLYIATTQYNLLNCINIKKNVNADKKADIIITDFSSQNFASSEKLRATGIFEHVYFVQQKIFENFQTNKSMFFRIKNRINNRFFYEKLFSLYCNELDGAKIYDNFYFDSPNYLQRFIFYHLLKLNKNINCFRVDCGIECYYGSESADLKFAFLRVSSKKMMKHCKGYFLNLENAPSVSQPINKIPQLNINDAGIINNIFNYLPNEEFEKEKILFMDQLFDDDVLNENLYKIAEKLESCNVNFAVKLHPRREDFSRYLKYKLYNIPYAYEISLLNTKENVNDKILISTNSTAVFLPKLLFDFEPYVIIIQDIVYPPDFFYSEKQAVLTFMELVKENYRDKSRVIMVKSVSELISCLKCLEGANEKK